MRKREWVRCSDAERMMEQLWRLGDLNFIGSRPFFFFVPTAGERLWAEVGGEILRPTVELAWRRAEREASEEEVTQHVEVMQVIYDEAGTANNWQLCRLVNVLGILFREPGSAARTLVFPHPMSDPESPPAPLLQDAGCDNDDILNHCRQPGEHVKGCWVVDLVLGKE